jgi:hypothetical protein
MKVLTVRQPWAGLIAHGFKDIENRTWTPDLQRFERFGIHAGLAFDHACPWDSPDDCPRLCRARGLVIATVRLVDVVTDSSSQWAQDGCYHWVIDQPRRLRSPIEARGRLRLWSI